jgi:hypothetical protein
MELLNINQYNQSITKYKLLSSTAGVGAVITTKIGYYVLVSDINKWGFIQKAQRILNSIRIIEKDNHSIYKRAQIEIPLQGISFIDDKRFVEFIKTEKELPKLICLVGIPSISLNEYFNTPNWKNHPINLLLDNATRPEDFMVKGTHFPKWFIGGNGELKTYIEWKKIWDNKRIGSDFVPPRDPNKPIKNVGGDIKTIKGSPLFKLLTQTNLILICPNGHLSDIPWPKFLRWKSEKTEENAGGENLFGLEDCCSRPDLLWTESKTKSEGYGSIFIECRNCGRGSGRDGNPKINLEGINNLKPNCQGHKPWEIDKENRIPHEDCFLHEKRQNIHAKMQVALVTGNNVYFSNGFSSLYVPRYLAENKTEKLIEAKTKCTEKYEKYLKIYPDISKEEFWYQLNKKDFLIENGFSLENSDQFFLALKEEFLHTQQIDSSGDRYEQYRWAEYQCFVKNSRIEIKDSISFKDIELPAILKKYFYKIQQIEELRITQIQLDFTRVRPKERVLINGEIRTSTPGKNIFSISEDELYVLPANQTLGEGLFFQFNENEISGWIDKNLKFAERFKNIFREFNPNSQGGSIKQRIKNNGFKHFLIHTFSHILMRELEFTCGYPTASLKERLYISDRMEGVLIFTAEGSEGSMGGLVWQGEPKKIVELIRNALERTMQCSSDPLCWESEGQGIYELNLAACFSCSLVSETACEEMNLGLDRRVIIDENFGFFNKLLLK